LQTHPKRSPKLQRRKQPKANPAAKCKNTSSSSIKQRIIKTKNSNINNYAQPRKTTKTKTHPKNLFCVEKCWFVVSGVSGKAYIFLCSCLIQDVTCYMKVVQTTLSEVEHKLLEEYAKRNSMSIKDVLRAAVRTTLEGNTNPDDPIFTCPSSSKRTGKKDHTSEEHDKYLYGENI
jgi:hypothetical protein